TIVIEDAVTTAITAPSLAAALPVCGSIVYTASVNNAVTGSDLVVMLSNGQTITIPVGASSASSAPFAVRADDVYVQGDQSVSVSVTGTNGANFDALDTPAPAASVVS